MGKVGPLATGARLSPNRPAMSINAPVGSLLAALLGIELAFGTLDLALDSLHIRPRFLPCPSAIAKQPIRPPDRPRDVTRM